MSRRVAGLFLCISVLLVLRVQGLATGLCVNSLNSRIVSAVLAGNYDWFDLKESLNLKFSSTSASIERLGQRVCDLFPLLAVDDGNALVHYAQVVTHSKSASDWQLMAYDLDELALRRSETSIRSVLYWRLLHSDKTGLDAGAGDWNGWDWAFDGVNLIMTGTVTSLVWNGGFELPLGQASVPLGFKDTAGHRDNFPDFYEMHYDRYIEERNGQSSRAARLFTGQFDSVSMMTAYRVSVSPASCYLSGAWIGGEGGRLEIIWYSKDGIRLDKVSIAHGVMDSGWAHVSGIVCPPDRSVEAAVFLRVRGQKAESAFDDVFMIPVFAPPQLSLLLTSD